MCLFGLKMFNNNNNIYILKKGRKKALSKSSSVGWLAGKMPYIAHIIKFG